MFFIFNILLAFSIFFLANPFSPWAQSVINASIIKPFSTSYIPDTLACADSLQPELFFCVLNCSLNPFVFGISNNEPSIAQILNPLYFLLQI